MRNLTSSALTVFLFYSKKFQFIFSMDPQTLAGFHLPILWPHRGQTTHFHPAWICLQVSHAVNLLLSDAFSLKDTAVQEA